MAKVLITIATADFAGGSRMAYEYARAFVSAGHEVVAVCGPRPSALPSVIDALHEIGAKVFTFEGFYTLFPLALILAVARIAKSENASVIVSTLQADVKVATFAGVLSRVPVVSFVQNAHTFGGGFLTHLLKRTIYGFALRRLSRATICLSESLQIELCRDFHLRTDQLFVLPNGIDCRIYTPLPTRRRSELRASLGISDTDFVIVNVGRFSQQKGQLVLLAAFQKLIRSLPSAKLVLVGSATETPESAAYALRMTEFIKDHSLQASVLLPGWRSDVPELLCAADLYAHSALWEGGPLPLAIMEAMAAELPVIGTDCAGIPVGFVPETDGILVKAGNADALATAMETIATASTVRRREMARNARCLIERNYDIREANNRFVELVCTAAGIRKTQPEAPVLS